MDNAIAGLRAGLALVAGGAQRIVSLNPSESGLDQATLADATINMLAGRQQFEASAQVLEVEKQTLGTLLKRTA